MSQAAQVTKADHPVVFFTILGVGGLTLLLQNIISTRQALLFLIGVGLGISLLHAAFGFSSAWRNFIRERKSAGIRAQLLLFILVVLAFFPILGQVFPGLSVSPALGPVGVSVLVGAFLFGVGMELGSGCGSGTLYTVGGGHVNMLVTLTFFIVGSLIGTAHLPWWVSLPNLGKISMIDELGWLPAALLQVGLLAGLYLLVRYLEQRRHARLAPLGSQDRAPFFERLIFGPWPLSWGVLGLALFSLLTLLVAGHPWSITFAFGLWGAKLWTALGGDLSSWAYWSGGYPARALESSVLADVTSVMDFGIILGALLAAALAGSFAPAKKIRWNLIAASVLGGLLLGYGARLAFGCNIGGMFAGLASGSLHGWLWLVAGFGGSIAGVYLRIFIGMDKPPGHRT
jgi:hypothetical protein